MKAGGFLDFATHLHNPDFAKIANGADVLGLRAETPDQVEPVIARALRHDGPALVEVLVARQELSMPPTSAVVSTTLILKRLRYGPSELVRQPAGMSGSARESNTQT